MFGIKFKAIPTKVIRCLDQYALRSYKQLLVHCFIAIALAVLLYFLVGNKVNISSSDFVTIMSSIAAASGALLAISLAFATFMSRFVTDWRERSIDRLQRQREKLAAQMELSAQKYPDISRRLVNLYMLSVFYIPGQPIEYDVIEKADHEFHDWANKQIEKSDKKIDFGNVTHYDSFEKHLFDAHVISNDMSFSLTELSLYERYSRTLGTHPPLITGWAIILVYALVFAFIGSIGFLCNNLNFSLLALPLYLSIFSITALVLDTRASIISMRGREVGYEKAMSAFTGKRPFWESE